MTTVAAHCPNTLDHEEQVEMEVKDDWQDRDADETSGIPALRVRTLVCPQCGMTAEQAESLEDAG